MKNTGEIILGVGLFILGGFIGTSTPINNNSNAENNIKMEITNVNNMNIIDINSCDIESLLKLRGVGKSEALRIVENRPYENKFSLVEKGIMDLKTLENNKDLIKAGDS